jgi:hypothetical protein
MNPLAPLTYVIESSIIVFYVKPRWCAADIDRPDERAYAVTPEDAVRALREGRTTLPRETTKLGDLTPWRQAVTCLSRVQP